MDLLNSPSCRMTIGEKSANPAIDDRTVLASFMQAANLPRHHDVPLRNIFHAMDRMDQAHDVLGRRPLVVHTYKSSRLIFLGIFTHVSINGAGLFTTDKAAMPLTGVRDALRCFDDTMENGILPIKNGKSTRAYFTTLRTYMLLPTDVRQAVLPVLAA